MLGVKNKISEHFFRIVLIVIFCVYDFLFVVISSFHKNLEFGLMMI